MSKGLVHRETLVSEDVANGSRQQTVSNDARNNDNTRTRPIVVEFHKDGDRGRVRETSFVQRDRLKTKAYNIREQWPDSVLNRRQTLLPIMQQEKAKDHNVKVSGPFVETSCVF